MHTTILSWDGEALLGSYVRAKITIGYDRDIPCLYMVYAINAQQWIYSAKIVMNLQSCVRTCMYISLPGRGASYHPSNCIFTQHEFLTGICQAYTRHILIISHLQPSCGPSWSPKSAWMPWTWTFCGSFQFWTLKVLQLWAGVCQSSTASR